MSDSPSENSAPAAVNSRPREQRKQISLFIPVSEWRALRLEAARQQVPMTELCRRWLKPQMQKLHREQR